MRVAVKIGCLRVARRLGLFSLADRLTARDLRILCYHGASWEDEHRFRPALFMSPAVFEQRMRWLASRRFEVLALNDALRLRREGRLPRRSVVITIDDGWSGTAEFMLPVLRQHDFPATLYIATGPVSQAGPVLHVLVDYLLWRGRARQLDLSAVTASLAGRFPLRTEPERDAVATRINDHLRTLDTQAQRHEVIARLRTALGEGAIPASSARVIELLTLTELARVRDAGVDLQLHTHNHRMPINDEEELRREIELNRATLAVAATATLHHFCYPSGRFQIRMLPTLRELGIASATTCEPGFVQARTPDLLLPRFLDRDDLDPIVFEAEVSGLLELARRIRRTLRLGV